MVPGCVRRWCSTEPACSVSPARRWALGGAAGVVRAHAKNQADLDAMVETLGDKFVPIKCDISDVAATQAALGGHDIDLVVNNAGIASLECVFEGGAACGAG